MCRQFFKYYISLMTIFMMVSMPLYAYDFESGGIYYNIIDGNSVEVTSGGYKGEVIIPDYVTYNGIKYRVTSIGGAFKRCRELTSITIPSGVTSFQSYVFTDCNKLVSIKVSESNPKYDSRNNCNAIIETAKNELVIGCNGSTIPQSVISIGKFAFNGCSGLSSITIPDGVKQIGDAAFQGCICLKSIVIPEGVFLICGAAFNNCSNMEEITFPNSLVFIGTTLTFNCKSLKTIRSNIRRPYDLDTGFPEDVYKNAILIVPNGKKEVYQSCKGWKDFVNIIEDKNTSIKDDDIRTIHVAEAGTLSNCITDAEKYNIYDLTLTGELNGTDFRFLRDMAGHDYKDNFTAGKLRKLNLTSARIVSGGNKYLDTDTLTCTE